MSLSADGFRVVVKIKSAEQELTVSVMQSIIETLLKKSERKAEAQVRNLPILLETKAR
jgi:hypothetical protein